MDEKRVCAHASLGVGRYHGNANRTGFIGGWLKGQCPVAAASTVNDVRLRHDSVCRAAIRGQWGNEHFRDSGAPGRLHIVNRERDRTDGPAVFVNDLIRNIGDDRRINH